MCINRSWFYFKSILIPISVLSKLLNTPFQLFLNNLIFKTKEVWKMDAHGKKPKKKKRNLDKTHRMRSKRMPSWVNLVILLIFITVSAVLLGYGVYHLSYGIAIPYLPLTINGIVLIAIGLAIGISYPFVRKYFHKEGYI